MPSCPPEASASQTLPRYIVVQMGARHNYAVPAAFEQYGLLESLYTDLCGTRGIGRLAAHLSRLPFPVARQISALGARLPPPGVAVKTCSFDWTGLSIRLQRPAHFADRVARLRHASRDRMGRAMVQAGFGAATHVYSMLGEGGQFLTEAKRRGLKVVSDVYIALSADNIVRSEGRAFPGWGASGGAAAGSIPVRGRNEIMVSQSDLFVCPSEFVRDDLIANAGVSPDKTVIVPYMVDAGWLKLQSAPEPGRILFVGTADLRKGIHYLAMAAERLARRRRGYRFRIAGNVSSAVRSQPLCSSLEFIGRIPRSEIAKEFAVADLLVLPSLAEGSAGVTYEALGAGLPVITTKASGSVVRDGVDGFIVPERDPDALAAAIEAIVEHRARRAAMSVSARERALGFTLPQFNARLVSSIAAALKA